MNWWPNFTPVTGLNFYWHLQIWGKERGNCKDFSDYPLRLGRLGRGLKICCNRNGERRRDN